MKVLRTFALAATAATLMGTLAACGNDDTPESGGDTGSAETSASSGDKGSVVVGGQNFTEELVLTSIYQQVLENAGYDVTVKTVTTRDIYVPSLKSGSVDIVPDYLSGITDFLQATENGEVDMGETGTTDGTLDALGLVILEDDKGIQPAQNLTPIVNSDFLNSHSDIPDLLDPVSEALTTEDLAALNLQVDANREKPEDVAAQWLQDNGLI